jgi:Family of unknown function (DUF5302)
MSDTNHNSENSNQPLDPKEKFREALEKKKKAGGIRNNNIAGNSKIHGDQAGGGAPKMFRRKSGSA